MKSRATSFVVVSCLAWAAPALASDPVGVYALVDRVVQEPRDGAPDRVQVWGVFALADGRPGDGYQAPQQGYLYLALAPGQETACRREWADLKAVAGTGLGVGFGFRYRSKVRVRAAGERPESPDPHPIGIGVTKMGAHHHQPRILQELRALAEPRK